MFQTPPLEIFQWDTFRYLPTYYALLRLTSPVTFVNLRNAVEGEIVSHADHLTSLLIMPDDPPVFGTNLWWARIATDSLPWMRMALLPGLTLQPFSVAYDLPLWTIHTPSQPLSVGWGSSLLYTSWPILGNLEMPDDN